MKAQYHRQENHRNDIDDLIRSGPSKRAEKKLQAVRSHGNAIRQPDSASRQDRRHKAIGHASEYHACNRLKTSKAFI